MKKQEIKKDPIREKIVNFINKVVINRRKYLNYTIIISILLLVIIIFANNKNNKMSDYNLNVSINQNKYLDGIQDVAITNFQNIINSYSSSESYNQAFIYLLNNSLENGDYPKVDSLIKNNSFSTSDKTLESMIYNLYANYFLNVNDFKNAEKYYIESINTSEVPEHINKFKLNLIYLHLYNGDKSKADVMLSDINIEEIVPYQLKNKFEQLISSLD